MGKWEYINTMKRYGDDVRGMDESQKYKDMVFSILPVIRWLEDENDRFNKIDSRTIRRGRRTFAWLFFSVILLKHLHCMHKGSWPPWLHPRRLIKPA